VTKTQSVSDQSNKALDAVIQIDGVQFAYGHSKPVLNIRSLEIRKSEKIFIFGPSGSGKTTLLGLLAGVLATNSGSIKILSQDLVKMTPSERDHFRGLHIGYIFQMFNLIPYLSVLDNITLACNLNSLRKNKLGDVKGAARELAADLGIQDIIDKKVTELSVGQQQRVAVARALLGSPEVIIADEPTSALDTDHRERFLKLLFTEAEKNKSTVLFVSHDRSLEKFFDRSLSLLEINQS
jgi:putative ABC transport system ATP-binding protein